MSKGRPVLLGDHNPRPSQTLSPARCTVRRFVNITLTETIWRSVNITLTEAESSKADSEAMRRQSENLTVEYDRLLEEHQKLQVIRGLTSASPPQVLRRTSASPRSRCFINR